MITEFEGPGFVVGSARFDGDFRGFGVFAAMDCDPQDAVLVNGLCSRGLDGKWKAELLPATSHSPLLKEDRLTFRGGRPRGREDHGELVVLDGDVDVNGAIPGASISITTESSEDHDRKSGVATTA